jgi:hypothetical protein
MRWTPTLRPSGDYLPQASVFGMQSSRERRHYIRSVGDLPESAEDLRSLRAKAAFYMSLE